MRTEHRERVRLRCAGSAALLLAVIVCLGAPRVGAASSVLPFCKQQRVLRNYLAHLPAVPKGRGFSKSGRLRVGPHALRIYPPQEQVVALGRGRFEVQAATVGRHSKHPLNWWVVSRLERIDKNGNGRGPFKVKRQYVASVDGFGRKDFGFSGGGLPGFYRLSVEFENGEERPLATYQELFRAMPARSELRLDTSFSGLSPGGSGYLRVDNLGTVPASYGPGYQLFNSNGEEIALEGVVFSNILLRLHPGYAGSCFPFRAPTNLPSGEYVIKVEAGDLGRRLGSIAATVKIE